ncbi:hypothetical protein BsWGS_00232 [Bradybaena similaris]
MESEKTSGRTGVKCSLLPLHFLNRNTSQFSWLRSSIHQDTFVAKHEDGSFSILKVKAKGIVSSFVLDPNLRCVFWDNENVSEHCQCLFAQASNEDILQYSVDEDGVTETLHISHTQLSSIINAPQSVSTDLKDESLDLVGCECGHIILQSGRLCLFCVEVTTSGDIQLKSSVPLPHSTPTRDATSAPNLSTFPCYQIVNGTIVYFNSDACLLFIYSLALGECVYQLDLHPLDIEMNSIVHWRVSQDISGILLLLKDWIMVHVNISDYSSQDSSRLRHVGSREYEQMFNKNYLQFNLCRFGDNTWKQEVVNQHIALSDFNKRSKAGETSFRSEQPIGFTVQKKRAQKDVKSSSRTVPASYLSTIQLEESERAMNWNLVTMEATNNILTLLLKRAFVTQRDKSRQAICFVNFADNSVCLHRLSDNTSVILSSSSTCSHMLLSDGYLMFISPDSKLQKDDLITWMMSYSGPSAADSLCQVNQWTRTAIPLQALESSLKQRQLDTLAFFFKSKHNLFTVSGSSEASSILVGELRQLEETLNLVTTTVTSCLADSQGRMFAERLLALTMDFIYGSLEDARQVSQDAKRSTSRNKDLEQWCSSLLSHIPTLRKCLRSLQYKTTLSRATVPVISEQRLLGTDTGAGSELSLESCIQDNIMSSFQARLMSDVKNERLHYRELVAQLLESARQHMEGRDIAACQHILSNLGCDVSSTMWSLAQFYASRSLQQFITGQLSVSAALGPSQRQTIQYLEQLYKAYPCSSFSTAMKSKVEDKNGTWPDIEDPLQETVFASDTFLLSHCGELAQESSSVPSEHHDGLYAAVLLVWLTKWTQDMKQAVMLDASFLSSGDALLVLWSDPSSGWQYLISHSLLNASLSLLKSAASDVRLTVPAELTDYLSLGWSHLRSELATELLRLGKLNVESATSQGFNIPALLPAVGGIMNKPHPLSYTGPSVMNKFHTDFITYCISSGLQLPLWMYCSVHGVCPSEIKLDQVCSWFPLFQAVYSIPRHPTDRSVMLSASLVVAADLWQSSGEMTVETMLEKNQILAAMGTLCYMSEERSNLNASSIEKYLRKFPKLILALLPDSHESSSKTNTTVYHLLMGTAPFDLRKLFGWHSTNIYAGEDSPNVMPHFSEPHLKSSHSRHQKLSFPYYLKHGRPIYAFLSFLSEELDKGEATLSLRRVQQACGAALWIACQNFNTSQITSSCVVFVELLGRDSALVRSMIHAGRLLFAHRHRNVSGGAEAKKEQLKECVTEIVSELQACVRSRHRHGKKLIASLEAAIKDEVRIEGIGSCSFEAGYKWMLVIMMCRLLGLPLSTCFLQMCAESDNWLMFVWFAQLHQYPTHQLQMLLHSFGSPHLRDHLYYVLNNADCKMFSSSSSSVASPTSGGFTTNERSSQNQRASLYNKIGLQRSKVGSSSDDEEEKSGHIVVSSFSSRLRQTEFNESEMPESTAPEDVFRMLFHSSTMPSQWKCLLAASVSLSNPLFAELAACCGCPAIPSLCGWLLASLNQQAKQNLLSVHGQQVSKWTMEYLEAVIEATLSCGQEDSLTTAFIILQPQSPLLPFLNFITECIKRGNYAACKTYLDQFKDAMASSDNQKSPTKIASDVQTLGDRTWFEKITYGVIKHELKVISSLYHARHFLEILDKHNMCLVFSFDVLDFTQLHKIVSILHANSVPNLHLPTLLTSGTGSKLFVTQCEVAVDYLIKHRQFSAAQELTDIAGISHEKITMSQFKEEKAQLVKCGVWTSKFVRAQYWTRCTELIQRANCGYQTYNQFFQEELQGTLAEFEKAVLYQHWFSLLEGHSQAEVTAIKDTVFRDMWRHRIAAKIALEEIEPLDQVFDDVNLDAVKQDDHRFDLVDVTVTLHSGTDVHDLSAEELEVLDSLMGSYLEKGRVSACTEVAAVFGHYNQELAIIQTCIALATRQTSVDNIEPAMKRLIAKNSTKRVRASSVTLSRSFSITSISSIASGVLDISSTETQEIISVMEKLYTHCDKGSQVCLRIITCFKIAQILTVKYKDVVLNSPFDSLRQLLRINDPNKFALARDFLATSGLSDDEVTGFLADSIVEVLKIFVKGDTTDLDTETSGSHSELMFNPSDGMEVFSQFLKLCENTALLGDRILQAVASFLSSSQQQMSAAVLTIQTELIIMAHECYTISSNMEGISHVLRTARVYCDYIAEAQEYTLMIRLLTGVGRYSEMLYIFHALQQRHQFELLLRKGMDREDKLKVAILDYLKRYQPDDNEAYTMVALKFTMYRDIAGMLVSCGYRSLKHLKDKSLDNSKDTQDLLKKCLQYFRDAAESYVKDNSVRKAQHCVKQARLLSLQLQLLPSGVNVINLNRDQVAAFVNNHGRFIEAMVVSDAYDRRADWTEAIFNNVVINGDMRYLQEMRLHVHITSVLVEDVVKRYKQATSRHSAALTAITKLLTLTKDVQLQYRLASELGLTDVITTLLKGDTGCYLQDITPVL